MTDVLETNLLTVEKLRGWLYDKPADANVFVMQCSPEGYDALTTKVKMRFYDGEVTIESK